MDSSMDGEKHVAGRQRRRGGHRRRRSARGRSPRLAPRRFASLAFFSSLLLTVATAEGIPPEDCCHVIQLRATPRTSSSDSVGWRFTATMSSPYEAETGWDKYCDAFEIRAADGRVIATRILAHPHPNEQPFARSTTGSTELPSNADGSGATTVFAVARDSVVGYCGDAVTMEIEDGAAGSIVATRSPATSSLPTPSPSASTAPTFGPSASPSYGPVALPSASPSYSPVAAPSTSPSLTEEKSYSGRYRQQLTISVPQSFDLEEIANFQYLYEQHTRNFGHKVGSPMIRSDCTVTSQQIGINSLRSLAAGGRRKEDHGEARRGGETGRGVGSARGGGRAVPGRANPGLLERARNLVWGRGRKLQSPTTVYPLTLRFTMEYSTRVGMLDIANYNQLFRDYVNSNLTTTVENLQLLELPVLSAGDLLMLQDETPDPTRQPSEPPSTRPTLRPATATPTGDPTTEPRTGSPAAAPSAMPSEHDGAVVDPPVDGGPPVRSASVEPPTSCVSLSVVVMMVFRILF